MSSSTNPQFKRYKIIASESKSWYVGLPGTTKGSFSVTWSPGAMLIYGAEGSILLIYSEFHSYESSKKWLANCTLEDFKGAIAQEIPDNIDHFFEASKFWATEQHFT